MREYATVISINLMTFTMYEKLVLLNIMFNRILGGSPSGETKYAPLTSHRKLSSSPQQHQ